MALLEDPTIQRILDEVNKAATGGIFGAAGNYVSEPTNAMAQFQSQLSSSEKNFYNQDQAPLFYPTPDMFDLSGLTQFDAMPSGQPIPTSTNFDLYSSGLYNTMPQSYLAPFEHYNGITKSNAKNVILDENNILRSTSTVSSVNNDLLFEQHRHQEYPTMPNLGLNVRTTPLQMEAISKNISELNQMPLPSEGIPKEMTNSVTSTGNASIHKEQDSTIPPVQNEDIDPENPSKYHSFSSLRLIATILDSPGQIFYDPNPQVIQRKGAHSVTYKQNIIVRFLQPPAIPNAGPLIIKEVKFFFKCHSNMSLLVFS